MVADGSLIDTPHLFSTNQSKLLCFLFYFLLWTFSTLKVLGTALLFAFNIHWDIMLQFPVAITNNLLNTYF